MTLPLTPRVLHTAYEFLRSTPPFAAMKLPPADQVEFHVTRAKDRYGDHTTYCESGEHIIRISEARIGHTYTLLVTMAHEMIHASQARRETETSNSEHNAEFRRIAARVCKFHGFDPKEF